MGGGAFGDRRADRLARRGRASCLEIARVFILACAAASAVHAADPPSVPAYEWRLPPGFPRPQGPANNPMSSVKVELGRRLFHETGLSSTGGYACASCHRPELAFTDGRARALGATREPVKHAAMSLAHV